MTVMQSVTYGPLETLIGGYGGSTNGIMVIIITTNARFSVCFTDLIYFLPGEQGHEGNQFLNYKCVLRPSLKKCLPKQSRTFVPICSFVEVARERSAASVDRLSLVGLCTVLLNFSNLNRTEPLPRLVRKKVPFERSVSFIFFYEPGTLAWITSMLATYFTL